MWKETKSHIGVKESEWSTERETMKQQTQKVGADSEAVVPQPVENYS